MALEKILRTQPLSGDGKKLAERGPLGRPGQRYGTTSNALGAKNLANYDFTKRIVPGLRSDRFASSKALLLAAGPPVWGEDVTAADLVPLGVCQDLNLQQQRQVAEIFELGSRDKYHITDGTSQQLSLSRLMFYGPTLMRAMYEGAKAEWPSDSTDQKYLPGIASDALMFLNLDSVLFEQPIGVLMHLGTIGQRSENRINPLGTVYLEEILFRAHNLTGSANRGVISENAVLTLSHVVPVDFDLGGPDTG